MRRPLGSARLSAVLIVVAGQAPVHPLLKTKPSHT